MASMKVQLVPRRKLVGPAWSYSFRMICIFMFVLAREIASQCPFQYLYHLGDGITDIGNSILVKPAGPSNPAASLPYGRSIGRPTGRWSDGLIDFDFSSSDFGLPNIVPYLAMDKSAEYNGVIFSVARSPVLDISFSEPKGVKFPPYAVPLSTQFQWFKDYINSVESSPEGVANRLNNSLVLMGDIEGNDIGYALAQGKTIDEVRTYAPLVIEALINTTKEIIKMGATRIIIPGNGPLGCYPYILTALDRSDDPSAYDNLGCLKSVNSLIQYKNDLLQKNISDLNRQYPNITINYGNFSLGVIQVLTQASTGANRELTLKACCGTGGKYNYNSTKFCGSEGVPVCPYPTQYIFWDGLHFTQLAVSRMETILVQPALQDLGCTTTSSALKRPRNDSVSSM